MGLLRGVIDSVSAKLAFFPPSPPSYEVKGHGDRPDELYISPMFPDIRQVLNCEVLHVKTKPHRVDLGQMLPFYRELSKELRINVLGYDYSGYGCSTGTPSVSNTIADINACYQFLLQVKGKRPQDIVVYGQSVGSGPTCDLGASEKGLRGIVLHSPLMSGMRVLSPSMNRWPGWMDIFPNITLLPKVEAKTLIMHGDKDEVVPFEHGKALHKAAKNPYPPLWASGFGHQNLEFCTPYLPKLQEFLRDLFGKDYGKM
ncbi:hypothetical protein WJX82_000780 [Trebouxia sp. C0006]